MNSAARRHCGRLNHHTDSSYTAFCSRKKKKKKTPIDIYTMAILNKFTTACWRNFQGDRPNRQLFSILRALHKSAASEALGISAAGEESMAERLIAPADVGEKATVKTLKEMPGPSTLSNLIEFFWRDGFSRIHEIQVTTASSLKSSLCFQPVAKSLPNLPPMRKMARTVA